MDRDRVKINLRTARTLKDFDCVLEEDVGLITTSDKIQYLKKELGYQQPMSCPYGSDEETIYKAIAGSIMILPLRRN